MDLIVQQDRLQKQAQEVLDKLNLIRLLKNYGDPEVVGSMALGLMTWRDIDLEIVVEQLSKEVIAEIIKNLVLKTPMRIDITFSDNNLRFNNNSNVPKSLYIGLKYFGKDIPPSEMFGANPLVWKLDLHFLLQEDARSKAKTKELKNKLTEDKRKIILEIKNEIAQHPKYRKRVFSMDIYQAVLNKGVKNLGEFKEYFKKSGREL